MNTQKHCTKCGKELLPNNKFCVSCGAEIKSPKENFNVKNKTGNENKGYNRLIMAIALIVVFLIIMAVSLSPDDSYKYSSQSSNLKNNSLTPPSYSPKVESKIQKENNLCSATTINNLSLIDNHFSSKLFDLSDWDNDIKFDSNEMKVFGIIKNSSDKCYATNVKMKFSLIRDDGEVMQEETFILREYKFIDKLLISPRSTREFSKVFKVYDSLIVGNYYKDLKPNIKVTAKIISAEWNRSYSPYIP